MTGYRYSLHRKDLPGGPDIAFPGRRKLIFVHGCFWHQHPGCKRATMPTSNCEYWTPKIQRNVVRDAQNQYQVQADGWRSLIVWECQVKDAEQLLKTLTEFLGGGQHDC